MTSVLGIALRKLGCRKLSFHEKICKKVHRWSADYEVDVDFTAWIRAIQKATIRELGPEVDWIDDETLIQVRRMTAEDLESQVDLQETEHEYEDTLDVIKLPLPIPTDVFAPQFLFIRPDEYALFKCFGKEEWCILTGNPGISKSCFQWKFILFCYRQDLFYKLSPFVEEQAEELMEDVEDVPSLESLNDLKLDDTKCAEQVDHKDSMDDEKLSKKPKIEEQTFTEQDYVKEPAKLNRQHDLFIPNLIVRTLAGEESLVFFVGLDVDVLHVEHSLKQLKSFTDENTTILWEPGSRTTPVYYEEVKARILVTVSPNEDLIHQFKKYAETFYMPCPSQLQICLMGQVYRRFATELKYCPTDAEICERVRTLGPFIRKVLCWSEFNMTKFRNSRRKEIKKIVADNALLHPALESPEEFIETQNPSHRLARFVVHRDSDDPFFGYAWDHYQFSCDEVQDVFCKAIAEMDIEHVIQHLIAVDQGSISYEDTRHVYLERLFRHHALSGLEWKIRLMPWQQAVHSDIRWEIYRLKLNSVVCVKTTFQNMEEGVLYYPSFQTFPLVDMYYKDELGELVGIQATTSKKHPKAVSTYEKFYEEIGTTPIITPLKLYYLIIPRQIQTYEQNSYPDGQFWQNVKQGIGLEWRNNISFYALVPPNNFRLG